MENKEQNLKILKAKYIPTAEFYSQIIDSLQDYSIFTLDKDFNINSWSSGSTKIFGYETDDVIGEPFDIIFTDEDLKSGIPKKEIETALKEGRATDNRWHITKDKKLRLSFSAYWFGGRNVGLCKNFKRFNRQKTIGRCYKKICGRIRRP